MGLAKVSMRGLARTLGVGASTLYYHVQSREQLQSLISDRLLEQLRLELGDPRQWRHAMLEGGRALRALFVAQPGLADNAMRDPQWGDTIVALHEAACAHLVEAGFSPGRAFLAVRAIADLAEAHSVRAHHHQRAGRSDLEYAADAYGHHPALRRALAELGSDFSDQRFDYALRSLIRGIDKG